METILPGERLDKQKSRKGETTVVEREQGTAQERAKAYWRENLKLLGRLLVIWFAVSFGAGILAVDWLNQFDLGGIKLGFWFAQQGSIYVFVALIFVYARQMRKLEKRFGVDD